MWYGHPWFLTGKINVGGKEITIITLHFDWACIEKRAHQIKELIAYAKQFEYCMIIGDVNPDPCQGSIVFNESTGKNEFKPVTIPGGSTHEKDNKHFTDAGFDLANCGKFGRTSNSIDVRAMTYIVLKPNALPIMRVPAMSNPTLTIM